MAKEFDTVTTLFDVLTDLSIKEASLDFSWSKKLVDNLHRVVATECLSLTYHNINKPTNILVLSCVRGLSGGVVYNTRDILIEEGFDGESFKIVKTTGRKQYDLTLKTSDLNLNLLNTYYDSTISILHKPEIIIVTHAELADEDKLAGVVNLFRGYKKLIKIYS